MIEGRRWSERDRFGNDIYLTQERWEHITEPTNHPEIFAYENELRQTIRMAQRKQLGLRSLPLDGLNALSDDTRELVLGILQTSPVKDVLSLSTYTPSASEAMPIASLQQNILPQHAAQSVFSV